ncbi:MAG: GAF domain-containing sensor histidine kinase [Salinirussus sp.]
MSTDLHDAARGLLAARTEQAVRHTAVRTFAHLSDADRCEVIQPDDDGLASKASVAFGPNAAETPGPLETHGDVLSHSFEHGTAGLIDDLADVRSAAATAPDLDADPDGYRSMLCVPIENHGLLVATHRQPGHFSGRELESMQRLADLVAAALDRFDWGPNGGDSRLEAVARVISHDVQNAIGVANGRLELAMDGDLDQLEEVAAAHERLLDLTDDLVAVLRTGDSVSSVEPADLATEARRAWTTVESPTATLECVDEPTIMADITSLCQLLENLFRNAVDHGNEDITVTVGELENGSGFYVADDGPGIPPAERESVFEMGYTTGENQTGYGLSIVQRIADAHGWDIEVVSSTDGGARFELSGVDMA